MRIAVDTAICAGHARCNAAAPGVYDLDDDGFARPLVGEVPVALEEQARLGAEACPERAITVS